MGKLIVHTVIKISHLKSRFDVRYHTSGDAELGDSWSLKELKETIVRDPNCYGFNYSTYGIPLIRISDMKQPFIDFSRAARVSEDIHRTFKKTQLRPYDILISVRGMSTGKVSIFLGEVDEANISPNIIIVRLKNTVLAPYVAMVLISDIGQSQIKRFFSGGGKPSLTSPMINQIRIPKPSDGRLKQINDLFDNARLERLQAQKLKEEIDTTFTKAFQGFRVNKNVTSMRKVKGLGARWDAHYHNDGYVLLRAFIEKYEGKSDIITKIASLKKSASNDFDKKSKVEYIEIGSINNLTGVIDAPIVDYPDNLPEGPKVPIIDGDILLSK